MSFTHTSFFSIFDQLTTKQKQLFKYLQWCFRRHPTVFVSHAEIAEHIGVSREYVCRMLSKFFSYNWIRWVSRGKRRSNMYLMDTFLIKLQISKREQLLRNEITSEITPSCINTLKKNTSNRKAGSSYEKLEKGKQPPIKELISIQPFAEKLKISYELKLKLSMCPEGAYQNALDSAKWKKNNGWQIKDPIKYVVGTTLRIAERWGTKLNWRAYYTSLKAYGY